jgi:hypothetical protein
VRLLIYLICKDSTLYDCGGVGPPHLLLRLAQPPLFKELALVFAFASCLYNVNRSRPKREHHGP